LIPLFPNFKLLEIEDRGDFEKITAQFEPYSDFNFISLWSYNTEGDTKISLLNDNLVIKFRDYITNEPFYSYIGNSSASETIESLLKLSASEGLKEELKLIPEINILQAPNLEKYDIQENIDNHDYILSVEEIALLSGDKYHTHKNFVNRFQDTYDEYRVREINLLDPTIHNQILEVFYTWEKKRNKGREETQHELIALKRLLDDANEFNVIALGVYDRELLVGFIVASLEQMKYSLGHFSKSDTDYHGISYFMYHNLCRMLMEKGYKFLNNEQDLGIPGLRKSKEQWNPTHFLKKYTITLA
jgi:hypothetical protein